MRHYNVHIIEILIVVSLSLCCESSIDKKQTDKYPEKKVANNWTLRLPYELKETELRNDFYQQAFVATGDSILFKVSSYTATIEQGLNQFNYIVGNEKQGKVSGPCMGSSTGYYKHYNFIDSANMLSGVITDYEENGQWRVMSDIVSAKTGGRVSFAFEKVAAKDIRLIHEVIRSIRYYK